MYNNVNLDNLITVILELKYINFYNSLSRFNISYG